MSIPLGPEAEKIRKQIKQMIPETAVESDITSEKADGLQSNDGRILYSGGALVDKVIDLRKQLQLGNVFLFPQKRSAP
jgi:hypothetical protein